jgi:hypothetical protein
MPSKHPAQRLSDIIDNVDAIEAFTAGLDFEAFRGDRKMVYAVIRALELSRKRRAGFPMTCARSIQRSIGRLSQRPGMSTGTSMKQ